jgi:lysozyme family protein
MQSSFDRALAATLKHEGGWADHPKDPGGATMKGVTLATFRRLVNPKATKADLKAITADEVSTVYRKGFWSQIMADEMPAGVDFAVFDYAVNSGPSRAVKAVQSLCGLEGNDVDGVVGPQTLKAISETDEEDLIMELCAQRLAFVKRLKTWPTFGKGWESRIAAVRKLALEMAAQPVEAPEEPAPVPETPSQPSTGFQINWFKVALWVAGSIALVWAINAVF